MTVLVLSALGALSVPCPAPAGDPTLAGDGALRAVRIHTSFAVADDGSDPWAEAAVELDLDASAAVAGLALELPGWVVRRFSTDDDFDDPPDGFDGHTTVEAQDEDGDGLLTWTVFMHREAPLQLEGGELRVQVFAETGSVTFVAPLPPFAAPAPPRPAFRAPEEGATVERGGRFRIAADGFDGWQSVRIETLPGPLRELEPAEGADGTVAYGVPPAVFGPVIATVERGREDSFEREGVAVQRSERVLARRAFSVAGSPLEALLERPDEVGPVELGVTSFDVWGVDPLGLTFAHHATAPAPGGGLVHVLATHAATFEEAHRLREVVAFVLRRTAAGRPSLRAQADGLAARRACFVLGYDDSFEEAVQAALALGLDPIWVPAEQVFTEGSEADLGNLGVDATLEVVLRALLDEVVADGGPAGEALGATFARARDAGLWRGAAEADAAAYVVALAQAWFGQWAAFADGDGVVDGAPLPCADRASLLAADPEGAALVRGLLGERLDLLALVDPGLAGAYHLAARKDLPYSARSRHLDRARLRGRLDSDLVGNDADNELGGNAGDNTLYGGAGRDVALFLGSAAEYQIETSGDAVRVTDTVEGRDGRDLCFGIEVLRFADREIAVEDLAG